MGHHAERRRGLSCAGMRAKTFLISVPAAIGIAAAIAIPATSAPTADKPSQPIGTNCPVFPSGADIPAGSPSIDDQRAWTQDISQTPVDPDSDKIIKGIGATDLHPDFGSNPRYGIPYVVVGANTKAVKTKFRYAGESDKGKYKIPLNSPIEGGKSSKDDRHILGFDNADCKLYELYGAYPDKKHHRWKAGSGAIWDLNSAGLRQDGFTSADAAGLPIFPGLVRYDEVEAGAVDHAIRVTFDVTRDAYIHPASHCASDSTDPADPAMGQRFRLKSSYDISGITGQAAPIAKAMQQYGMINADNGSDWYFSGATDPRWDDDSLNQLKEIPSSAFEVLATQASAVTC
jgi:hypothetical protein